MSKPNVIQAKLNMLEIKYARQMLMDVLELADKMPESTYPEVVKELETTYKRLLPEKRTVVKNRDLEELIESIKTGKEK